MPPKIGQPSNDGQPPRRISAMNIALWGFLAIGAFYLIAEHRAHLLGWLWLVILACPLLHFFMHGRHGGHDHRGGSSNSPSPKRPPINIESFRSKIMHVDIPAYGL